MKNIITVLILDKNTNKVLNELKYYPLKILKDTNELFNFIGVNISQLEIDIVKTIKSKDTNSYYSYNNRTVGLMFITPQDIDNDIE